MIETHSSRIFADFAKSKIELHQCFLLNWNSKCVFCSLFWSLLLSHKFNICWSKCWFVFPSDSFISSVFFVYCWNKCNSTVVFEYVSRPLIWVACFECALETSIVCQFLGNKKCSFTPFSEFLFLGYFRDGFFPSRSSFCWSRKFNHTNTHTHNSLALSICETCSKQMAIEPICDYRFH